MLKAIAVQGFNFAKFSETTSLRENSFESNSQMAAGSSFGTTWRAW